MRGRRGPALGTFMIDLGARLEGLPRDELVRLLLAHAERLPVDERNAFLGMFPAAGSVVPVGTPTPDDLLHRVRDFARRVAAGKYEDSGYEDGVDEEVWRGRYGWADEEPSPAWVADADALFADAGGALPRRHSRTGAGGVQPPAGPVPP